MPVDKRTYSTWQGMKTRCLNPRSPEYKNYGGRGITICERWRDSYQAFLEDMGKKPEGLSIDRIDNDGNYEPGNCRWATKKEQRANQRTCNYMEFGGKRMMLAEWAKELGMNERTLTSRMNKLKWSVERALSTPTMSAHEAAKIGKKAQILAITATKE